MANISYYDILAFTFSIGAFVPYLRSIVTNESQPTISWWLSSLIMDGALLTTTLAEGELVWPLIAYIVGNILVLITLCFQRYSIRDWERKDSICVGVVLFAAFLWMLQGDAKVALLLTLVATGVGMVPLLQNLKENPRREPLFPWVLCGIGGLCSVILFYDSHSFRSESLAAVTPISIFLFQIIVILMITRRFVHPRIA